MDVSEHQYRGSGRGLAPMALLSVLQGLLSLWLVRIGALKEAYVFIELDGSGSIHRIDG